MNSYEILTTSGYDVDAAGLGAVIGVLAGFGVAFALVATVLCVLTIIAMWKIFTKAGEAGWKSIIPVYNFYILAKIAWKPMIFWIFLVIAFLSGLLSGVPALAVILGIAEFVLTIIMQVKLAKAFGHGAGFAVGLIFLNTIFTLILGFGKSEYVGNGSAEKKEETAEPIKTEE